MENHTIADVCVVTVLTEKRFFILGIDRGFRKGGQFLGSTVHEGRRTKCNNSICSAAPKWSGDVDTLGTQT